LGLNVGFNYGGGSGAIGAFCEKVVGIGNPDCDDSQIHRSGIIDVVATLDPTENLSVWANYDYSYSDTKAADLFSIQAIALAGRLAVMDGTGLSGRFEYVDVSMDAGGGGDAQTYTVTVDHELTAGLNAKFEYAYETLSVDGTPGDASASVINAQLLYEF
jgi:predicted porin